MQQHEINRHLCYMRFTCDEQTRLRNNVYTQNMWMLIKVIIDLTEKTVLTRICD
jgi:hypothetical protein